MLVLLAATAAQAAAITPQQIAERCAPGTAKQFPGSNWAGGLNPNYNDLTPDRLSGVTSASASEVQCIINSFGNAIVVIAALNPNSDKEMLPQSLPMGWAVTGRDDPGVQNNVAVVAAIATGGDKARPIIVYCHNVRCFMSYNLLVRLQRAGYTNLYWGRTGLFDWKGSHYPLVSPMAYDLGQIPGRATSDFINLLPLCEKPAEFPDDMPARFVGSELRASEAFETPSTTASKPAVTNPRQEWLSQFDRLDQRIENCLGRLTDPKFELASAPVYKAELARLIAQRRPDWVALRNDANQKLQKIADDFDANPSQALQNYLVSYKITPQSLRATYLAASAAPSIEKSCGTIDYDARPASLTRPEYDRRLAAMRKFVPCAAQWIKQTPVLQIANRTEFRLALNWVKQTRPFLCSVKPARNCLPDQAWQPIAAIATEDNDRLVTLVEQEHNNRDFYGLLLEPEALRYVNAVGYVDDSGKFTPHR